MPNDFGAQLSQAGAVGLNASTSHDATKYYISMPVNKLELWFALEAERFRVGLQQMLPPLCLDRHSQRLAVGRHVSNGILLTLSPPAGNCFQRHSSKLPAH